MRQLQGTLIDNRLASFMLDAIEELKWQTESFNDFTEEAIVFALIEYARHPRNTSKEERLIYLYEKAYLYNHGKDCTVTGIIYLPSGDFVINTIVKPAF